MNILNVLVSGICINEQASFAVQFMLSDIQYTQYFIRLLPVNFHLKEICVKISVDFVTRTLYVSNEKNQLGKIFST